MSVDLADYRARRARLGLNDNAIPLVKVPTDSVPEPATEPADPLKQELSDLKARLATQEATIDAICAAIETTRLPLASRATALRIAGAVARAHRMSLKQMLARSRQKHLIHARWHAMYEIRKHVGMSTPEIGRLLGGMDHSTVLYGIEQHRLRIERGEIAA